ncbi:MAG: sugar ABC transporter permease [Firmicutes bacterium]|uniref:Sugar ABC transporter permease n=1 Tax=Candidatus Onthovivens merdipullorum TaxID=2840889 RepID=A0A9D9DK85_9BACL|nr:sugar ABC transporter permease [Candidatus Onthovivens merdipullorum]
MEQIKRAKTYKDKKRVRILKTIGLEVFFIVLCIITLIPIFYALSVSFNANNSLISTDFSFFPTNFTFDNYVRLFKENDMLLWFGNSLLLAISTVVFSLAIAIPAAYAFSRMNFKGKKTILKILILLNAFPSTLSLFAIWAIMRNLGLVNTKIGLIIIYTGTMAIFGIWNLKGYFDTVPCEIEEASMIDGASNFQIITRIVMPLAKPAIIVTAVMVLIYVWNEYLYSVTFMTGSENYTLAAGLYGLQANETSGSWPIFAAASLITSLPILIIFLLVQKHMVSGLSSGGVKG